MLAGGVHRGQAGGGLAIDRGELPPDIQGGAVGRRLDCIGRGVELRCPVQQLARGDVIGHRIGPRRLVLLLRGSRRTGLAELADYIDDIADDRLIPDDTVDLGGGQGLGRGESRLILSRGSLRSQSRGDRCTENEGKGGESRSYAGDSTGKNVQEHSISCGARRWGLFAG